MIGLTFIHDVMIKANLGPDIDGDKYAPEPTGPHKCRVELSQKSIRVSINGVIQEAVSAGFVTFPPKTRVPLRSILTYDGNNYTVVAVEPCFGFEETHVEVTLM